MLLPTCMRVCLLGPCQCSRHMCGCVWGCHTCALTSAILVLHSDSHCGFILHFPDDVEYFFMSVLAISCILLCEISVTARITAHLQLLSQDFFMYSEHMFPLWLCTYIWVISNKQKSNSSIFLLYGQYSYLLRNLPKPEL